ncbi:MAG: hypothetical protein AAGI46_14420 [Planctomycetota bacterium]
MRKHTRTFAVACIAAVALSSNARGEEAVWRLTGTGPSVRYDASQVEGDEAPNASDRFTGVEFTGLYANYTRADTWYPTWASDGHLYSPWTDGTIGESMQFVWSGAGKNARTGHAKISGDDPMQLTVSNWGTVTASAAPYQGRYPCGSLMHDGIWYYGTYALDQPNKDVRDRFGWYTLGPFVGFRWSNDYGATWNETPHTPSSPLFDEPGRDELDLDEGKRGPFIKMGAPHFVDFGKNMEHSPDGKAYLVGHGAKDDDAQPRIANSSWVTGDAVYMARVTPSVGNINDASKYEFYSGEDAAGESIWTTDFEEIEPILYWNNRVGIVTITYNAPLDKYLMCITDGHRGDTSRKEYTSYIMESDRLTGPWRLVAHMPDFGPQAYFLNFPSKFISDDGLTMWLAFSANYMNGNDRNNPEFVKRTTPPGSAYSLSLHEMRLVEREE